MKRLLLLGLLAGGMLLAQKIGVRPYEMDWAGRTEEIRPALLDFETDEQWRVESDVVKATVERSREQQMYGKYVLKVRYTGHPEGRSFKIRPPKELPVSADFDALTMWVYGNQFARSTKDSTNRPHIDVMFRLPDGKEFTKELTYVRWNEWFLCHIQFNEEEQKILHQPGVKFAGFEFRSCRCNGARTLYFDSLVLFKEPFEPLTFKPRARRGLELYPEQNLGINTGNGKLPFPTSPWTILPNSGAAGSANAVNEKDGGYVFGYEGQDGRLEVAYKPVSGTWNDIQARWNGGPWFRPLAGGGVRLTTPGGEKAVDGAELKSRTLLPGRVKTVWTVRCGDVRADVTYSLSLQGKTLIVETQAKNNGNSISAVNYGEVTGLQKLDSIEIPYYDYASQGRPAVVLAKSGEVPLFLSGHTDWYVSNGSRPMGVYGLKGMHFNGRVDYIPKTDGKRNDVCERFFVTVSPKFEEHLPNLPNPKSPWKHITGTHLWRAHGAGVRAHDKKYWYNIWRHGMRECLITDHETMWRDGEESFTFRTRTAPRKGGEKGARDYSDYMQKTLGFVYGPYNNFTDFAPVNEYWSLDMVSRRSDNQLQHAWYRCYAPKPLRAVEYCEKLSPINQEKYHFSTAYCDVHTSVTPWSRCDYDWRCPGAGTFSQVFYAYGEIMLLQKAAWNGPVYSEGPHFCYYSGLTDGNYAQDRSYRLPDRPWLVDFDLRKIHEQECNFGIGNPSMFYGEGKTFAHGPKEMETAIDRFLACTVAFGHPGFLVSGSMQLTMRSYFLVQQLAARYTQASVASIRYADGNGKLWETSDALVNGVINRSQVVVDYKDGTHVVSNGSRTEQLTLTHCGRKLDLPPNGFAGWTDDGAIEVFSGDKRGSRTDYAESPEYIYIDGRDDCLQRFPKAEGRGCAVCRADGPDHWEIIPINGAQCGFAIEGGNARALAQDGSDLGPARTVRCRGMLYVLPVKDAVSYRLERKAVTPETALAAEQQEVAPGETIAVKTPDGVVKAHLTGKPGQTVWFHHGHDSLCFSLRDVLQSNLCVSKDEKKVECTLFNRSEKDLAVHYALNGSKEETITVPANARAIAVMPLPAFTSPGLVPLEIHLQFGELEQTLFGGVMVSYGPDIVWNGFMTGYQVGMTVNGHPELTDMQAASSRVEARNCSCGGAIKQSLFMHPPYRNGVSGAAYSLHDVQLPEEPLWFRGIVGKCDGSYLGDGIRFQLAVIADGQPEVIVGETVVKKHQWLPLAASLARWAGRKVTLKLISDCGKDHNTEGDWAAWAEMSLEREQPRLAVKLDQQGERYVQKALDSYVAGISEAELRKAKSARLKYRGQGLSCEPNGYHTVGYINDVKLGIMPAAGGRESQNIWSEWVSIELPKEAIAALTQYNCFIMTNDAQDYFKVRDFHLEVELADGRKVTSKMCPTVFTQPTDWTYGEGVLVPFGANIFMLLSF